MALGYLAFKLNVAGNWVSRDAWGYVSGWSYLSVVDPPVRAEVVVNVLLTGFALALIPLAYRCANSAVQFLAERQRRISTGSGIDELLAVSQLDDKEILAGFVYTRLAPMWRMSGWLSLSMICVAYFDGIFLQMLSKLYAANSSDRLFLIFSWFFNEGGLTTLLLFIVIGAWMLVGLVFASLIWFLYYICVCRGLQGNVALNLAVFSMLAGQIVLIIWLKSSPYCSLVYAEASEFIEIAACGILYIGLLVFSLALARRLPAVRTTLAWFLPAIMVMVSLIYLVFAIANSDYYSFEDSYLYLLPFYYTGYSVLTSYLAPELNAMIHGDTLNSLAVYGILLLTQLIQVPIVISFATEAVRSRRARPT